MFKLNPALYYCTFWEHHIEFLGDIEYEVCVSEAVPGNESESLLQYHILIKCDGHVPRWSQLRRGNIYDFECEIKQLAQAFFTFRDTIEQAPIRVWYYPENEVSGIPGDPTLRMALTLANVISTPTVRRDFHDALERLVWEQLK